MVASPPPDRPFPAAMVNITNRCTLRCGHCFIYRDGNPNDPAAEMDAPEMLAKILERKRRHGLRTMLWMGGEPLLRPDVLEPGVRHFQHNTITTNGTLDLLDLPQTQYVVSLDGPPEINDQIRGQGTFERVMRTLGRVPGGFGPAVLVQCVVTRMNGDKLEDLVQALLPTCIQGLTFSFYVPTREDRSPHTWGSLERRDAAVLEVMRLKQRYPHLIRNRDRSLELMLSPNAKAVTDDCPSRKLVLPLYLEGRDFVTPYCCYGNDVDCDLCGAWVVFYLAARLEPGRPWADETGRDAGPAAT